MASRRIWALTLAGCVVFSLLFALIALYSARTASLLHAYSPLDDAYIYVRYADHILQGRGIVWNADGAPTFGISSTAYLFVVTAARGMLPVSASALLQILSCGLGVLSVFVMAWAVQGANLRSSSMRESYLGLFLLMVVVFSSKVFLYHSLTGMETTLAIGCNSLLIGAVLRLIHAPSLALSCLVGAIGFLCFECRPEAGLYAVFFPALMIYFFAPAAQRTLLTTGALGIFAGLLVVDGWIKETYFGSPVPLSFFVKRMGFFEGYVGHANWNDVGYLFLFAREVLPFLLILLFTARRSHWKLLLCFFCPVVLHFLYLFTVVQIMGSNARYYMTALPFVAVPAMITLDSFLAERESGKLLTLRQLLTPLVAAALLMAVLSPVIGDRIAGAYRMYVLEAEDRRNDRYLPTAARNLPLLNWSEALLAMSQVVSKLPAGTVVAMSEVGYPGVMAPKVRIVDLAGLNDTAMAEHGFSLQRVLNQKPDLIWLPHYHYTRLVAAFIRDAKFREEYDFYPEAFDYGVAVRKDSPVRQEIFDALSHQWKQSYPHLTAPF